MNRRKGKTGNASAKASAKATPTPTPKPSTPTPPATTTTKASTPPPPPLAPVQVTRTPTPPPPTPPPPPTQSELVRAEWKAFEIWLVQETKERLALAREIFENTSLKKKPRAGGLKSQQKSQNEKDPGLEAAEFQEKQKIAKDARVEWERRLSEKGLDEEQWADITEEEMAAVEHAFAPPENPSDNNPQPSTNGHTSPLHENSTPPMTSPGGWNVHPSVAPSPPQTQTNGTRQEYQKPSPPLRTRSPSMSSWETHTQLKDNGPVQFDADDSLWTKAMNGTSKTSNFTKPAVSSPLAQPVHDSEPEIQILYRIITPVTIEEEDGDFVEAGFEGLSEGTLEDSIRQFHVVAADADIDLRRKLLALRAEHLLKRKKLIEQHRLAMERSAREVVDEWKAARAAEKARRLNGSRRPTINGYDRRAPPLSHAQSTTSSLSQTSASDMFPGKKGALRNGTTNGKKSGVTFEEEPSAFGQERVASPFNTPFQESGPGGGNWAEWGGPPQPKVSSTAKMSSNNMWGARDTPSPAPGRAPAMAKSTSSAAQAAQSAWMKKSAAATRTNGSQARTPHATVEDANSDDDDDEEEEEEEEEEEDILVGFGNGRGPGHGNGSSSVPGHTPSSASASWNHTTSAFSRGTTPKPDTQARPRTMSNAKTPWAEATAGGYNNRTSAFGGSVSGGFGEQQRFATWKPQAGMGLGTSPPIGGGEFGRSMVESAMNNLSQNGGSEEELANVLKMASSGFETNKRRPVVGGVRR